MHLFKVNFNFVLRVKLLFFLLGTMVAVPWVMGNEYPSSLFRQSLSRGSSQGFLSISSSVSSASGEQVGWYIPFLHVLESGPVHNIFSGKMGIQLAILDEGLNNHDDLRRESITWIVDMTMDPSQEARNDPSKVGVIAPDIRGHGTQVTGLIDARQGNDEGIIGVAENVEIYFFKVASQGKCIGYICNENPVHEPLWVADAIKKAARGPDGIIRTSDDADVISMSFKFSDEYPVVTEAIEFAASNGVILVAASGNDAAESVAFPASHPDVISPWEVSIHNYKDLISAIMDLNLIS